MGRLLPLSPSDDAPVSMPSAGGETCFLPLLPESDAPQGIKSILRGHDDLQATRDWGAQRITYAGKTLDFFHDNHYPKFGLISLADAPPLTAQAWTKFTSRKG
jgi:hypothetical protein